MGNTITPVKHDGALQFSFANPTEDDVQQIISLLKQNNLYHLPDDSSSRLLNTMRQDPQAIPIAYTMLDKKPYIVACAIIVRHPYQTFLYRFCVDASMHKQGIGRKFLRFIEDTLEIDDSINEELTIFVQKGNQAIDFWKKTGWRDIYDCTCLIKNVLT